MFRSWSTTMITVSREANLASEEALGSDPEREREFERGPRGGLGGREGEEYACGGGANRGSARLRGYGCSAAHTPFPAMPSLISSYDPWN